MKIRGSELCLAIVGPLRVRSHQLEGMRMATLHHTEMAKQLDVHKVAEYSTMEFTLGCSSTKTFREEVVGKLVAEF
jgi:hypothetical protein